MSERLVVGLQPVREAIRVHGSGVVEVLVDAKRNPRLDAVARFAEDNGVRAVRRVPRSELDRVSGGVTHQGVAARAPELVLVTGTELLNDAALLAVALDSVQDPQNFGAVIRSAVAVAGAAVVWPENASAPLTTATGRASAGGVEHARLCRVPSLHGWLSEATGASVEVVGLEPEADRSLRELDLTRPTVLVIGSEHSGMKRAVRRACSSFARLVRTRGVQSLNASVAAGIALYEAAIQREISGT